MKMTPDPALKFAPFGRWDAYSARPLAPRYAFKVDYATLNH